jgi:Domain of unknown function (DUF4349)
MKKMLLAGAALLAVTACSKAENDAPGAGASNASEVASDAATTSGAAADAKSETPPDIGQQVAPGVAFAFNYAFSLPEAKISATQEAHAALCARLGISRCRVTGLTFNKSRDGAIDARLAFKIDPALALSFGRDAGEIVERADGKLETSEVSGEDVGTKIVAGDKNAAALNADLARINVQLAIPKLSNEVRQQLLEEARDIKQQLAEHRSERGDQVESLATTPVQFTYEPSEAVLGFQRGSAVQTGLSAGAASFGALATALSFGLGAFGPWILLGGLMLWGFRRLRKARPATTTTE